MTVTEGARGRHVVRIVGKAAQPFEHVGFGHALDRMAKLGCDQFRGIGVDHIVDGRHHGRFSSAL